MHLTRYAMHKQKSVQVQVQIQLQNNAEQPVGCVPEKTKRSGSLLFLLKTTRINGPSGNDAKASRSPASFLRS